MFFCPSKKSPPSNLIFIKDMIVEMAIGAYESEIGTKQRVRINVTAEPTIWPNPSHDNLEETVSYDIIVGHVFAVTQSGHIHLAETVADKIADACLAEKNIRQVTVRVEKLDIFPFAISGVEIIRSKA